MFGGKEPMNWTSGIHFSLWVFSHSSLVGFLLCLFLCINFANILLVLVLLRLNVFSLVHDLVGKSGFKISTFHSFTWKAYLDIIIIYIYIYGILHILAWFQNVRTEIALYRASENTKYIVRAGYERGKDTDSPSRRV